MNTKQLAFVVMMGALGNVLFAVSYYVAPIVPGIIAVDFSLIAVLIAGFFGGPIAGLVTGLIAGILPGVGFGPLGAGGVLGLIALPVGKALTGLTAGLLARSIKLGEKPRSSFIGIPLTLLAYVPEFIFTYAYFAFMLPFFLPANAAWITTTTIIAILAKAWTEVTIMGFLIAALLGNTGFKDFLRNIFGKPNNKTTPNAETK